MTPDVSDSWNAFCVKRSCFSLWSCPKNPKEKPKLVNCLWRQLFHEFWLCWLSLILDVDRVFKFQNGVVRQWKDLKMEVMKTCFFFFAVHSDRNSGSSDICCSICFRFFTRLYFFSLTGDPPEAKSRNLVCWWVSAGQGSALSFWWVWQSCRKCSTITGDKPQWHIKDSLAQNFVNVWHQSLDSPVTPLSLGPLQTVGGNFLCCWTWSLAGC